MSRSSAAITKAIWKAHTPGSSYLGAHPLGGLTVAEWVKEARAGWPRVPVPKDPIKAAQRLVEKYDGTLEFES